MGTRDPRIDAYIEKSAEFARPILSHLRELVHRACPEVKETMKWSMPAFEHHGPMASMASFKQHCSFGLWKGSLILENGGKEGPDAMGQFGRITSLADLPPDEEMEGYLRRAAELNQSGVKAPRPPKHPKPELVAPDDLLEALRGREGAVEVWEQFSPSAKREYVEWILDAKTDATRQKRLATAAEWISEGKQRQWKYQAKP